MVYFNPFLNLISPNYKYIKSLQQTIIYSTKIFSLFKEQ